MQKTDACFAKKLTEEGIFTTRKINIEFSSVCNLRCAWCTLDGSRKKVFISSEILNKTLDDIIKFGFWITELCIFNGGETLLHPNLMEMLRIISNKKGYIKGNPETVLVTNATLLTDEKARELIDTNALSYIRFSIDGGTEESYRKIRVGADWNIVKNNVTDFVKLNNESRHPIKTGLICIVPSDHPKTVDWMEDDFKNLFKQLDIMDIRHPHNWDGSRTLGIDTKEIENNTILNSGKLCAFLERNLVIFANGDVAICCADLNARGVIGNIQEDTLAAIYLSEKRMGMIDKFMKNRKEEIELCKNCAGYF